MHRSHTVALILGLCLAASVAGAPPAETRYGVALDLKEYPQASAKETLASVIKAIEAKRFDYLLAQLAEPAAIDERTTRLYEGKLEPQVEEARLKLDASAVKLFQQFLKDGEWTTDKMTASARLKDIKDTGLFFRLVGERWYLENRKKPSE